ncbi:ankyrin repeat domain-containing protein 66 [Nothobranchius furzeri]|uniref:Ankyrin repeat domain-containing protein 66-like n=1 Tax=Nothobranchius furzeri TaxID=105023 RepID=A0A9D2XFX1_NOTFU|nr:ankyrin repeat domain-containing protein 66-like [Nothobranchius furzeri]
MSFFYWSSRPQRCCSRARVKASVTLDELLLGNDVSDMTELHQAAAAGNIGNVKKLLAQKYNPNQRDIDWGDKTPLHWAAAKGHTEVVRILVEHGARPCLKTEHGWTPVHFAAEAGQLAVLQLLHSVHAPMDKEDCCREKPVRLAEIYGHRGCVQFLKKAETECQAYRKKAAQEGISMDDTDEEWAERSKERENNWTTESKNKKIYKTKFDNHLKLAL